MALPKRSQDSSATKVLGALAWSGGRGRQDTQSCQALSIVFVSWARSAWDRARLREHVSNILDSGLRKSSDDALVISCLVLWRGCLSKLQPAVTQLRFSNNQYMLWCRKRATKVVSAALASSDFGSARVYLLCWHFHVVHGKLQHSLEGIYTEQLDDRQKYSVSKKDLDDVKLTHHIERESWEDERLHFLQDLQIEHSELEKSKITYQDALNERKLLEQEHAEAALQTQQLISGLARTESETLYATEKLMATEAASASARYEVLMREAEYEEMIESAKLEAAILQAEAFKQQERRQKDVMDLKKRLRTQLNRHEDTVHRLEQSCQDDNTTWTQKLRHSELRCSKLENDVQAARKNLQGLPVKTAAIEAENAELLKSVQQMEARLRQAEGVEAKRRAELSRLRSAHAKVQAKTEDLERLFATKQES